METYVVNTSYDIEHENGTTSANWGYGNDNLAFDGDGNLWVFQDGGNNYIWLVETYYQGYYFYILLAFRCLFFYFFIFIIYYSFSQLSCIQ